MLEHQKFQYCKIPSDSYFLFICKTLLELSGRQKIIYIAKDLKTLEKITFNLKFCNLKYCFSYVNHCLQIGDEEHKAIKIFDSKRISQINNASLFFDTNLDDVLNEKILFSDFDTALTQSIQDEIVKNVNIKNLTYSQIIDMLVNFGYERVSVCHNFGEFCVRGEIIDIIKPKSILDIKTDEKYLNDKLNTDIIGYRLQFFGENVEEIFAFDVGEQVRIFKYDAQDTNNIFITNANIETVDIAREILQNKNTNFTIILEPFFDNQNQVLTTLKNLPNTNFIFFEV